MRIKNDSIISDDCHHGPPTSDHKEINTAYRAGGWPPDHQTGLQQGED
jgi:hypothetical protein